MATISTALTTDLTKLEPLAQRLNAWRAKHRRRQRLPEEFWLAAAELSRVHGLSRTSAALRLNYSDLKRRLSGRRVQRQRRLAPAPFIELVPPALSPGLDEGSTLELVQASGARLTLRLPNATPRDLLPLVHLFLRHRP